MTAQSNGGAVVAAISEAGKASTFEFTATSVSQIIRKSHERVFEKCESQVRSYCRNHTALFTSAEGSIVSDREGRRYIDFMSACGSLNYGHNHPNLKEKAISYLIGNGIATAMDFHTEAKLEFIEAFNEEILKPRSLDYRMQFPGPTGTNCVEAALKLARKKTGRFNVVAFTNAFHGVSMGALAATGSTFSREALSPHLNGIVRLPFDGYHGADERDLDRFAVMAKDPSGGIGPVAAVIVECVQGEGGLNVASVGWLRRLSKLCEDIGALLIVDDIQTGCGRTGDFFGFERADIVPDLVCLAKSISGYGFPMSLLLMRPEHDVWKPGEHNGTFRGNSLAFVTAAAALRLWTPAFRHGLAVREAIVSNWCESLAARHAKHLSCRGIGLMRGLAFVFEEEAESVMLECSDRGLLIECCGPRDEVVKIMPSLNIDLALLEDGLEILAAAIGATVGKSDCEAATV